MNPPRRSQVVDFVNTFGVRALCPLNDHREWLVETRARVTRPSPRQGR
ncbi:MAG: hypothetical protein JNJ45_08015 [Chthonomonas sp.]|nr:hypothetical protein [Chthonomonas sp.]